MRHRMDIERMSKINPSSMSMRQSASRVWTEQGLAFDLFAASLIWVVFVFSYIPSMVVVRAPRISCISVFRSYLIAYGVGRSPPGG